MFLPALAGLALSATLGASHSAAVRVNSGMEPDTAQIPLTVEALNHMTTFWESFLKEPLSVRDTGRKATQKMQTLVLSEVSGMGRAAQVRMRLVDMIGMAQKFPSVAADLKQVGLTPEQWEQLRKSVFAAATLDQLEKDAKAQGASITISQESLAWKNAEFLRGHQKEFDALKASQMWFPKPIQLPGNRGSASHVDP